MKIAYFWTEHFSCDVFERIVDSKDIDITLVLSQPDRPTWRKKTIKPTPLKEAASARNIEVIQPEKLKKNSEIVEILKSHKFDCIVVVSYWNIIPKEILDIPKYGCINVHGSILPEYRGATPIQQALLSGDSETGITIMQMDEWLDTWDILAIEQIQLTIKDKAPDIFHKMAEVWSSLLLTVLKNIDIISPLKQDNNWASSCKKIEKKNWEINFNSQAIEIYNKFRAYYTWPWIFTYYNWKKLNILDCFYSEELITGEQGLVIKHDWNICVICWKWYLILKKVKLEWKKELQVLDFINWQRNFINSILTTCLI